jgi:hypothetical protein
MSHNHRYCFSTAETQGCQAGSAVSSLPYMQQRYQNPASAGPVECSKVTLSPFTLSLALVKFKFL